MKKKPWKVPYMSSGYPREEFFEKLRRITGGNPNTAQRAIYEQDHHDWREGRSDHWKEWL